MKCHLCKEEKLSKEFPHEHLTKECTKHPLLHCLRCVTKSVSDHQKCSVSECSAHVTKDNTQYKQYVETLEFLFPTVAVDGEDVNPVDESESLCVIVNNSRSQIFVTTLSGECISIEYNPDQTISDLKEKVFVGLEISHAKQCLLFNDTELEVRGEHDRELKLKDYNVQSNSTIHLLVLLYAVPEDYDHVIFDLYWGYPETGRDFLDASVFLFSGSRFIEVVDYRHKESRSGKAVKHSGDVMSDDNRLGHHTIDVWIKSIPPSRIDRLVFTLSAWKSSNISKYPNISLQFFDAKCPNKQLCDEKMDQAMNSQSIIMCFFTKRNDKWRVERVKYPSHGNALDYNPLKSTITKLIEQEKGIGAPGSSK